MGLYIVLDIFGYYGDFVDDMLLVSVDFVLFDIKVFFVECYCVLIGGELVLMLCFVNVLVVFNKVVWLCFVLVFGLNDDVDEIVVLVCYVVGLGNIEWVDVVFFE